MTPETKEHDDPALKSAIRRAIGGEAASPRLRARVEALMGNAPTTSAERARWRIGLAPQHRRIAAAAAMVLFALGLMAYQIREEFFPTWGTQTPNVRVVEFPVSFAASLTRTHDNCAKLADHHLIPGEDFAALREKLSKDQGFDVFAAALGDGWSFKGAGECQVESVRAAHLLFVKGDDVVSVFSMLSVEMCGGESYAFEQTHDNHPIATVRNGGVTYSVVASRANGDITTADIRPVFTKVQQLMCPGGCKIIDASIAGAPTTARH